MGPRERPFSPTHQERCRGKKSTIFTCSAPCTCSPCYQRQCLTPPPRGHAVLLSRCCAKQGGCLDTRGSRQLPYQRRRAVPVAKLVRVGIEAGAQCLAQSPADRASSALERDRLYPRPCSPPAVTALTTWHGGSPCEQLVSGRPRSLPPTESQPLGVSLIRSLACASLVADRWLTRRHSPENEPRWPWVSRPGAMDPITWERAGSIRWDVATAGWMETLASLAVRELLSRTEPALLEVVWMPADHTIASQKTLGASTRASQVQLRVSSSPLLVSSSTAIPRRVSEYASFSRTGQSQFTYPNHYLTLLLPAGAACPRTWRLLSNRPQQSQQSKETYMKLQKTRPTVLQDGKIFDSRKQDARDESRLHTRA